MIWAVVGAAIKVSSCYCVTDRGARELTLLLTSSNFFIISWPIFFTTSRCYLSSAQTCFLNCSNYLLISVINFAPFAVPELRTLYMLPFDKNWLKLPEAATPFSSDVYTLANLGIPLIDDSCLMPEICFALLLLRLACYWESKRDLKSLLREGENLFARVKLFADG